MQRRELLSVVGGVLVAGCSTTGDDQTTEPTESTTTRTPTETPTPTPSAEERAAARDIGYAAEHVGEAVDSYAEQSSVEGGSILDVDASRRFFDWRAVNYRVIDARHDLDDAAPNATPDQEATIRRFRDVGWYLRYTARSQANLSDAVADLRDAVDRAYRAQPTMASGELRDAGEKLDAAADYRGDAVRETSVESVDVTDHLSRETYEEKLAQLEREIGSVRGFGEHVETLASAVETFDDAADAYHDGGFETAGTEFYVASLEFGDVHRSLAEFDPVPSISGLADQVACVAEALAAGAEHLEDAAKAASAEKEEARQESVDRARESIRSCDTTERVEPAEPWSGEG